MRLQGLVANQRKHHIWTYIKVIYLVFILDKILLDSSMTNLEKGWVLTDFSTCVDPAVTELLDTSRDWSSNVARISRKPLPQSPHRHDWLLGGHTSSIKSWDFKFCLAHHYCCIVDQCNGNVVRSVKGQYFHCTSVVQDTIVLQNGN